MKPATLLILLSALSNACRPAAPKSSDSPGPSEPITVQLEIALRDPSTALEMTSALLSYKDSGAAYLSVEIKNVSAQLQCSIALTKMVFYSGENAQHVEESQSLNSLALDDPEYFGEACLAPGQSGYAVAFIYAKFAAPTSLHIDTLSAVASDASTPSHPVARDERIAAGGYSFDEGHVYFWLGNNDASDMVLDSYLEGFVFDANGRPVQELTTGVGNNVIQANQYRSFSDFLLIPVPPGGTVRYRASGHPL